MPELPLVWFEGKPLVYLKSGRKFQLEADPSIKPDPPAMSKYRVSAGLLLEIDLELPKPQSSK